MAGFWMGEETQEWMDLRLTRALVLLSFAAHLTLVLLAGIRQRRHSGVQRSLVWLAYHVTEIATPVALGKVFVDTVTAIREQKLLVTYKEQQMFAFWAPFLLLHLGRPDNITSYALENKGLSPTQSAGILLEIGGAIYGSYKQRFMRRDGALRAAFFIMLFFGSYKYVERAVALHRASFANIRRSNKKKIIWRLTREDEGCMENNDDIMLDAHGLLGVTMAALTRYRYKRSDYDFKQVSNKVLSMEDHYIEYHIYPGRYKRSGSDWKDVSNVAEMVASLMYDILYTKASVIHTWGGYIIRVLSPLATATALYLFHNKEGQAMESADRRVTYILLVGTLVLDVIWLLRALGSTWTCAFLIDMEHAERPVHRAFTANSPWPGRLKKAGRRAMRQSWYWLRRLLICLDPSRLPLRSGPSGHMLLSSSGVVQHNLLHECSSPRPRGRMEKMISFCGGPGKKKVDVKEELLEVMCTYLVLESDRLLGWNPIKEFNDFMRPNCNTGLTFQRNLIALHVATDIFLLCKPTSLESEASPKYEKKIRALSDYMMFLLAQRQHMVLQPGQEGRHYEEACLDLKEIWRETGASSFPTTRETKLANILLEMNATLSKDNRSSILHKRNNALKLGADWALMLLHELDPATHPISVEMHSRVVGFRKLEGFVFTDGAQTRIKELRDCGKQSVLLDYMLQNIHLSWVRVLTWMSDQCSMESHAKQLSYGGELLTIIWLMKQHGAELNLIPKHE